MENHCPDCGRSGPMNYIITPNGTRLCGWCGTKLQRPEIDRITKLEHRVTGIENNLKLDAMTRYIKRERAGAWMGLPPILERLDALEAKLSGNRITITPATVEERIAAIETWRDEQLKSKGRRR